MRTKIFRVLAALLSLSFVWVLVTADHAHRSVRELAGFCFITLLFGVFALFGPRPVEKLLADMFGIGDVKPPDDGKHLEK